MKPKYLAVLCGVCILGLMSCKSADLSADRGARNQLYGFRNVSIREFMSIRLSVNVPLKLTIPTEYKRHKVERTLDTVWAVDDDWALLSNDKNTSGKYGFIVAKVSMNVGYDPNTDLFFDGTGYTEKNLAELLTKQGLVNCTVERTRVNGYPVLFVQADMPNGLKARMIYIAMKVATNSIFIQYHCRQPWSDLDSLAWKTLKESVTRLNHAD